MRRSIRLSLLAIIVGYVCTSMAVSNAFKQQYPLHLGTLCMDLRVILVKK